MGRIISGERERTTEQIEERALKAATGFKELGLGDDDTVAVMLRNDFSFLEASRGATYMGGFAVPVNWHFKGQEVEYILNNSKAKALVIHADLLPQVEGAVPEGVAILVVETPPEVAKAYGIPAGNTTTPPQMMDWDEWLAGFSPIDDPSMTSRGSMFYTSGTTGNPKGVKREPMQREGAAQIMMHQGAMAWGFTRMDFTALITGPLYHSAPNGYLQGVYGIGADLILQPRFDAEDFLRLVEKHKVTHAIMVPTMFVRLLALPDEVKNKYDTSSLEFITHGAAPCSPEVKEAMIDWLGPVVNEYFGGTEIGLITTISSEEALKKPGSVGKAIAGAHIRIFDEDGNELGPNEPGEVYVGSDGLPDFTYHELDDKRREIEREGLVCIGDIGFVDEEGYLFLRDRKVEMVISGGVNIYPAEIEHVLITMPEVHDCAVFGIPDKEFGETLCAYVQPEPGMEVGEDDIKAFLRERIAGYKVPRVVKFAEDLPREDSGKIFKRKLREPYWEGHEARI